MFAWSLPNFDEFAEPNADIEVRLPTFVFYADPIRMGDGLKRPALVRRRRVIRAD